VKTYIVRCIWPGDELPAKVLMLLGSELTVIAHGEVIYKRIFDKTCEIEFGYVEEKEES
jgi:hypothetical protein